jgi:hypothetical protein
MNTIESGESARRAGIIFCYVELIVDGIEVVFRPYCRLC